MKVQINAPRETNVGGALRMGTFKPARFESAESLVEGLSSLRENIWPTDPETRQLTEDALKNWYAALHPAILDMLKTGDLAMTDSVKAAVEGDPAVLTLVPAAIELPDPEQGIEARILEIDRARVESELVQKKTKRLIDLGEECGAQID
jgi:hypothetical protein